MYTELMKTMTKVINEVIDLKLHKARFDRSYQGRVIEILGGDKCSIEMNGQKYTARYYRENLSAGDIVWVCAPRNDWNNLYII